MEYLDLSLSELHDRLVKKEVTPLELAQAALARAKKDDTNAFERLNEEEALKFAESLVEPEPDNLLWGIPYLAKDNFSTKGLETTASSNILNGYVPLYDATVIEKLRERKCVLIGKTTLDELAMGGTGTTGHKGPTTNPYDHTRQAGGSSCGSAAAVASSIVLFALGSDTGDSVRKPASYTGLVGLKPTWGRISRYGLFPFAPSLDAVAFFTRDVASSAAYLEALSGRDNRDSTSSSLEVPHYIDYVGRPSKGFRIAVIKEIVESVNDGVLQGKFEKLINLIKDAGVTVDYVSLPKELLESVYPAYMVISCAEATSNDANLDGIKFGPFKNGKTYQEVMFNARNEGFSELIKRRFVIGSYCLMSENQEELFLRAQRVRAKIVKAVNDILLPYDFLLAPAAPSVAPEFGASSDRLGDTYLIADNHLAIGNFAGLPSITLPLGFEGNLPLGVNLTGRAYDEGRLFTASGLIESLTGLAGLSALNQKRGNL